MAIKTRPQITQIEYVRAPWRLRLRWWLSRLIWSWGKSFEESGAASPDQTNPWWRR